MLIKPISFIYISSPHRSYINTIIIPLHKMVIKGRGKFPQKKKPEIPPPTPNITKIASLTRQPASDKALELLHEVATLVTPVMHHYNFKVGLLCEMYPKDQRLLGLNVNHGQKICLRLRSATDSKWFLDRDEIIGTMLHELTHNWHGPHDAKFYKSLDELNDSYFKFQVDQSLKFSSYPNNFSATNILRKKNVAINKYTTKVTKLGSNVEGKNLTERFTLRDLMRKAAERRLHDSKICTENDKDKLQDIPNDSDLHIIDVINLDSEDEFEENSSNITKNSPNIKKEKNDIPDIIVLD